MIPSALMPTVTYFFFLSQLLIYRPEENDLIHEKDTRAFFLGSDIEPECSKAQESSKCYDEFRFVRQLHRNV